MAEKRLGIIMNGVTGRYGHQPASDPVDPRHSPGRRRSAQGRHADHARSDPGRTQCREGAPSGRGQRCRALDHRPGRRPGRQERRTVFRFGQHAVALRRGAQGHRGGQAHLCREADRRIARRRARHLPQGRGRRDQARRGAGQALPAGPPEAEDAGRRRVLRAHAVGAHRLRLLGVRGRSSADPAAELELPQEGRRRHHPRYDAPLALRGGQHLRHGERVVLPGRQPYPDPLGRAGAALRGSIPTTRPTRSWSWTTAPSARSISTGTSVCAATTW